MALCAAHQTLNAKTLYFWSPPSSRFLNTPVRSYPAYVRTSTLMLSMKRRNQILKRKPEKVHSEKSRWASGMKDSRSPRKTYTTAKGRAKI